MYCMATVEEQLKELAEIEAKFDRAEARLDAWEKKWMD